MSYRVDFKKIATDIDIEQVAKFLNITLKRGKDVRGACPVCRGDERTLQIFPETNSFRCHAAGESGDCIALYAHINGTGMYKAALNLQEHFGTPTGDRTTPATTPTRQRGGDQPPASKEFDPQAFAAKLVYSDEVKALGVSEGDASRLGIGLHPQRKRVYFPVRNPDGSLSGFVGIQDPAAVKLPPRWADSNVVPLKRRG